MANTFTWTIPTLEHNTVDGGVVVAHWRCTGEDANGNTAASYGTVSFTPDPTAVDFVPYDSLTEADVLAWVWDQADGWKTDNEAAIATKIDAMANPTTVAGTPW